MLKYLQIYCFDIYKTLPIYYIFDEANTFTPIYFSSKDKCLDFHKLNIFFFKFDINRMPNIILLPILKQQFLHILQNQYQIYYHRFYLSCSLL